jgi:hypothetical protein
MNQTKIILVVPEHAISFPILERGSEPVDGYDGSERKMTRYSGPVSLKLERFFLSSPFFITIQFILI